MSPMKFLYQLQDLGCHVTFGSFPHQSVSILRLDRFSRFRRAHNHDRQTHRPRYFAASVATARNQHWRRRCGLRRIRRRHVSYRRGQHCEVHSSPVVQCHHSRLTDDHVLQLYQGLCHHENQAIVDIRFRSRKTRCSHRQKDRAGFKGGANWAVAQGPPQLRGLHRKQ